MSAAVEEMTEEITPSISLAELKVLFAKHLRPSDNLRQAAGCATGIAAFDRFLFWGGLPKGELSLFRGTLGSGATSLWLEAAAQVVAQGKWVAWINSDVPLSPLALRHKGVDLSRFIAIEPPADEKKLLWLLQELMSSSLFEMVGCDLGARRLREHQVRKLQVHARRAHTALTFFAQPGLQRRLHGSIASVFSLILNFEQRRILVERASHRPTPHIFPRSVQYARFTFHTGDRIGLGTNFDWPKSHGPHAEPHPLSASAT